MRNVRCMAKRFLNARACAGLDPVSGAQFTAVALNTLHRVAVCS